MAKKSNDSVNENINFALKRGSREFGSSIVGSSKEVVDKLESISELGFTKKSTNLNRNKNDAFGKIGL
jgi:hypothetical protein